ncbi:MAG TPA: WD40 repeat domain-containing protein [Oculatellaceae cyanobacterium]
MSFYNSAIAALFPLLLAISTPQPNISANSAIAQSTSPAKSATTSGHSAITKSWENVRLVHTIPDSPDTGVLAFSNDGQMLATGGKRFETSADGKSITETSDNIIKLWNINTGKQAGSLIYYSPSSPVRAIAFSPNKQIIASSSYNHGDKILVIKLWDVTTKQEIQTFRSIVQPKIHPELNNSLDESGKIAFTPDGKTLISIHGGNSTIQLWDVASTATAKSTLKNIKPQTSLQAETRYSDISHLNTLISLQPTEIEQAVRQDSNRYTDYVVKDQNTIKTRLDAGDSLETIKNNLKQSSLLVQQWRKTESPATYQAKTNYYIDDLISRITKEYIYLNARSVVEQLGTPTADGSRIFAGQGYTLTDQGNNFTVIANQGQRVILRMQNGNFDLSINTSNKDIVDFRAAVYKLLNQGLPRQTLTGHTSEITAFIVSPDSQILITGSKDKTIKQWNLKTGNLIRTLNQHSGEITSLAISKDNKVIASGSKDKTIKLWNLKTGQLIRTLSNKGEIYTVKFSLDAKTLITTSALQPNSVESHLQLWNVSNGKLMRDSGSLNWRTQLAINPDGKTYAIAGNALSLQILNLSTGQLIKNLGIEEQSAIFTPDGQTLVTFSSEGMKIWQSEKQIP